MSLIQDEKPIGKLKPNLKTDKHSAVSKGRSPTTPARMSLKEADGLKPKSSSRRQSKGVIEPTDVNFNKLTVADDPNYRPLSREERASQKFSHTVYDKAAIMFELLNDSKQNHVNTEDTPAFETEFERRRAYSLAFAAKRYEAVLKDVLLDSSFYSSYFKLETFHHSKVMVMLLDFYEHNFRFSDSPRTNVKLEGKNFLGHISEIQKAFIHHKIKLCSAFARNRIKACVLTLEGLLPTEVKERGECGARHPLYVRVNTGKITRGRVLLDLQTDGFIMKDNYDQLSLDENDDEEAARSFVFCVDNLLENLLIFPPEAKDEIFNHPLTLNYSIIPQSKPRHIAGEVVRSLLNQLSVTHHSAAKLIPGDVGFMTESGDVLLTHAESGSLAGHIDTVLNENRKLIVCGCNTKKRKDELTKTLRAMNVSNIELLQENFTDIPPSDERLKSVKIIVCNPPCSNSGVVNPVDYVLYEGAEAAASLTSIETSSKLRGIVEVQRTNIQHAVKFDLVQSVVYVTSSIHNEENKQLIESILREENDENKMNKSLFTISPFSDLLERAVLEQSDRSVKDAIKERKFLTMLPTSLMDGFFIAMLKRSVREETVREVMERASKKGLLKKKEHPKGEKKKLHKSNEDAVKASNSHTKSSKSHLSPQKASKGQQSPKSPGAEKKKIKPKKSKSDKRGSVDETDDPEDQRGFKF